MPTVLHRLGRWADKTPSAPAQRYKSNGKWNPITAAEFRDRVFHLALYLESKGFGPGDIGAILSYNCPEWVHVDLAPGLLKGKSAGLYPNASPKDIAFILANTQAKVLTVQNAEYFRKLPSVPSHVELVIVIDGDTSVSPKAVAYADAIREGARLASGKTFSQYLARVDKDEGAMLIYTSGTTGDPKGALLTHDNLAFTSDLIMKAWELKSDDRDLFSFLPLCHIAEKMQNLGVGLTGRYCVNYSTKFDNVVVELPEVQPHLLLSVPRLWEKMVEGVQKKIADGKGLKKHLAMWALAVGSRVALNRRAGRFVSPLDLMQLKLADKLVLSKLRHALGLARCEAAASGAAKLPEMVRDWFLGAGVEILEDFGQTESTGVITVTLRGKDCSGSVGWPIKGIEFKIAPDGEILTKGRHVFKGYYKNDAATRETIVDGWLHTGDLGKLDERGLLQIIGRKKEIMKSSGGKMLAPVPIEEKIKESPLIGQVCIVGDGRKYFSALVTLSESGLGELKAKSDAVKGDVVTDPDLTGRVQKAVDRVNTDLAGYEKIKQIRVLAREFSVDAGEMTPTLKMKRSTIESNYRGVIDEMYR